MKRCRNCHKKFEPKHSSLQTCCSPDCAFQYARMFPERRAKDHAMAAKVEKREEKEKLKSKRDWAKLAQIAFNAFIRERDKYLACISCGRSTGAKQNAGHYRSVGAAPHLRFNEDNCHKQCEHCNSWKSGNQAEYRPRLIARIGLERVEALENDNSIRRWDIASLKSVIYTYRDKLRELRKAA